MFRDYAYRSDGTIPKSCSETECVLGTLKGLHPALGLNLRTKWGKGAKSAVLH